MADLSGWDTNHYLELLRQQAEKLRTIPALKHLTFTPRELAVQTMARASDPRTKPCQSTVERDRLAWFLRIERDILTDLAKQQSPQTVTWTDTPAQEPYKIIGQALLDSTIVWDNMLTAQDEKKTPAKPPPSAIDPFDKYTDFELLSQGGMGEVYKCRDMELGRPVAMKLMHEHLATDPELVRYFNEEAQVAGQLQHPNVAPVHERGRTPEGRPYFTMKLIRGQTLAAAIHDYHTTPTANGLEKLLKQFVAVAETLDYAHQKEVLHRDLKPLNIMVGAFGEVQVMDWGLSKVLPSSEEHRSNIRTVRTGRPDAETRTGVVRGTFAYMSPEQADPERKTLDHRTDIFSLGAILCEILTGRPLYIPRPEATNRQEELWRMALSGHTGPAFDRLDASRAPSKLVKLTKQCLEFRPEDRPASASDVAKAVGKYFADIAKEERSSEIQQATHGEQRKKRRWQLALGLALATSVMIGLGAYLWFDFTMKNRAKAALREIEAAVQEVVKLQDEAKRMPTAAPAEARAALAAWQKCLAAAEQAERLTTSDLVPNAEKEKLAMTIEEIRQAVELANQQVVLANKNELLLANLAAAELLTGQRLVEYRADHEAARLAYAKAFNDYGVDVLTLPPDESAKKLRGMHSGGLSSMIRGLDYWNLIGIEHKDRPRQVADLLDTNTWRRQFRAALVLRDVKQLKALAVTERQVAEAIDANEVDLLGAALRDLNEVAESIRVLKAAEKKGYSTYALHMEMGISLATQRNPDYAGAAFYFKGATVINRQSSPAYSNLGLALMNSKGSRKSTNDEAETAFQKAIELQPDNVVALVNLAMFTLTVRNNPKKCEAYLQQALQARPHFNEAKVVLALCRVMQFKLKEADELLRELPPENRDGLLGLTVQLIRAMATVNEQEAGRVARKLAREHPHHEIGAYCSIIGPLMEGDSVGAEAAAHLFLDEYAGVPLWESLGQTALGMAQMYQGHLKSAEESARKAIRLDGNAAYTHQVLFQVLLRQGRFADAEIESKRLQELTQGDTIMSRFDELRKLIFDKGLMRFEKQVEDIVVGKAQPDPNSLQQQAEVALLKGHVALAHQLYGRFVSPKIEDAKLTNSLWEKMWSLIQGYEGVTHRTNAARAAIRLAASDAKKLTDDERQALRREGLELLRADFEFKTKFAPWLSKVAFVNRLTNMERLQRWLIYLEQCDDLATVRKSAYAQLNSNEAEEWARFWTSVRTAIERGPSAKKGEPR